MSENVNIEVLNQGGNTHPTHEMALSVLEGLSKNPKGLPSHLFYDDKGSELFKKIMGLEEYYPTQCEAEILGDRGEEIISYLKDEEFNLVELGCGDGAKTILLIDQILKNNSQFHFVPLDISKAAVEFLVHNLKEKWGEIPFDVQGLVAEYFQGLNWLTEKASQRNLVLFLGSNIGNFSRPLAMRFLRHLWYSVNDGDYVLIGFDLKKDLDTLYHAYNDSEGVTKEFNFNVLDRINECLGGDFKRENFQHQGLYSVQTGAMESYLISQCHQKVLIKDLDKEFSFKPWEAIHMEYSYKYLESDIEYLATSCGFEIVKNFSDKKGYFVDSLWRAKK